MRSTSSPDLRDLQRWFATVMTQPQGVLDGAVDLEQGRQIGRLVTPGPQLSAAQGLQIYNDGYFARLVECLEDDYPALSYALGESTFVELAHAYIEQHRSRSPSLNNYGQWMAAFCGARTESWAAFAADLARLEWALVEVVHEPASQSLAQDALSAIPAARWQTARLIPSRCLRVLAFDYPANDFFQAFREDRAPTLPARTPTATAVYRRGLALWRMKLEPLAALLLRDLTSGVALASAISALESRADELAARQELTLLLPQWLASWVQNGFFSGVELQ